MKKLLKSILILSLALSFSSRSFAKEIIRLTNGEWPPYLHKELKYYGVASRIVTEAFALEGITVEYDFFPWGRAYEYAKSGEWNGSLIRRK
ncbi:MAG: hypothetical protein HQK65_11810 [Desulfamplus sp.]|nr:hypothetical protein [Desulfamplus sp.]